MITVRHSEARGFADHGWLRARHSFSFADYYDPAEMGWGALRVINEDRVAPGTGFGMHGHRDMEILTYILAGALEHKDSMGHQGIIRRGEVQRMSAGKGVLHSEFNPSSAEETHLLQIWLLPASKGGPASYEQHVLEPGLLHGRLGLIAGPAGEREGDSAVLGQDARIYASILRPGETVQAGLAAGRLGYVHVVRGGLDINGVRLNGGDGARIGDESRLDFSGKGEAETETEFLFFDLPAI